jgi:prepilin-type N-terminal cleavage/methylation domain-containing protein
VQLSDLRGQEGFTLIETLVALFIVTIILLTLAQLMTFGFYVHRSATDLVQTTALAEEKLEQIRKLSYASVLPGGSLDVNVAGFFDNPDIDGDGAGDYARRWQIVDLGDRKEIWVRAQSTLRAIGEPKSATLVSVVAER